MKNSDKNSSFSGDNHMGANKLKIFVCYHNDKFPVFKSEIFEPIFCGKHFYIGKTNMLCDNTGDNISEKNRIYSELTGYYWVFKNYLDKAEEDYIGFCHYRRFGDLSRITDNEDDTGQYVLKYENLKYIFDKFQNTDCYFKLKNFDCVIPARDYFYAGGKTGAYKANLPSITCIEEMNICRKHDILSALIKSIENVTPEYAPAMTQVFQKKYAYLYNIFIMKKEYLKEYFEWEFKIFDAMEKMTNNWNEEKYKREAGYFGEKFINIWLEYKKEKNPDFRIGYMPVYSYDIVKESIERFKLFHSIKRYDLEIDVMEYLTTIIPNQPSLYKILSNAYLNLGKYEKSLSALKKFSELSPEEDVSDEMLKLTKLIRVP